MENCKEKKIEEYVRSIPDFPEEGVIFRDVTSILQDADGFALAVDSMQKLLEAFGILELVRTGMVALERGAYTIGDETKEQTEFNLGKNFL